MSPDRSRVGGTAGGGSNPTSSSPLRTKNRGGGGSSLGGPGGAGGHLGGAGGGACCQPGGNAGPPKMDDSYARMKKSVERISRVLGLTNPTENKENDVTSPKSSGSTGKFVGRDSLPNRGGVPDMIFREGHAPIDLSNQNNGDGDEGEQLQSSPYRNLR